MLPLFQDNFILGEATSSHFIRVTTSAQELLFRSSYFFRTAAFFSFCRAVTLFFQNSFFFGAKLLQGRHFLKIGSSLRQLLSEQLFFSEELFRIKTSKKELLFESRYFCTASTFSEKLHFGKSWYFRKVIFRIAFFFWRAAFFERLIFQKTLPSISAALKEELLFYNMLFQKSYYFTGTLPFHSYTSFLFVSN